MTEIYLHIVARMDAYMATHRHGGLPVRPRGRAYPPQRSRTSGRALPKLSMRVELIGHFKPCMTEIYLHIDARMADYIRTHPYLLQQGLIEEQAGM